MAIRTSSPTEAAELCHAWREAGRSLGFVPTMGALHRGHATLVERSVRENEVTVVSVFVNPLQFDDPSDLEAYPRDFEADAALLERCGCDLVFTGTLAGFFPEGDPAPVEPGPAALGLEGAHRPGHFAGVATIVARLFECAAPARAYFGEKDYQQCLVVRDLARRAGGGPEVVPCATVREADGVAFSSRNARLRGEERERARWLSGALARAHARFARGERDPRVLERELREDLARGPLDGVDYGAVRDPDAWTADVPTRLPGRARALVAARVGEVRLIDNLALDAALPPELAAAPGVGGA